MTTESTPRCDSMQSGGYDLAYFARTLERELAEAQAQATYFHERLEAWQDANGSMADRFDACLAEKARLREALTGAVEALEYARDHGLDNPTINGHKVLALRLYDARATLVQS